MLECPASCKDILNDQDIIFDRQFHHTIELDITRNGNKTCKSEDLLQKIEVNCTPKSYIHVGVFLSIWVYIFGRVISSEAHTIQLSALVLVVNKNLENTNWQHFSGLCA